MTKEQLKDLKSHSEMLGQIAAEVMNFSCHEDCTTLEAVRLALADLKYYQGWAERLEVEVRILKRNEKPTV